MDPAVHAEEFLLSNLALIDRIVAFTCRRFRLAQDEAEEFAGAVRLKLIENDYSVLRTFEGRSSFATFMTVVIQRLLFDYRTHTLGKWHASTDAKRLGPAAVELERLLHRDNRSFEEAVVILASRDPSVTRAALEAIADRLPFRGPKRRMVEIEQAESVGISPQFDVRSERRQTAQELSAIVREYIGALPDDERLVLGMRFDGEMSVADIARTLHLDQKHLYRTFEKHLRQLRERLEHNGIDSVVIAEVIGDRALLLEFGLGNRASRPSNNTDVAAGQEEPSR